MSGSRAKSEEQAGETPAAGSFLARLRASVNRGTSWLGDLLPGRKIDDELLEELELRLLAADVGVGATESILGDLHRKVACNELADVDALLRTLRTALLGVLKPVEVPLVVDRARRPFVVLVVGVNGSGKTTTIGKLAWRFRQDGLSVILAAGDTFRAAAVEQLTIWAERNQVPIIAQAPGADPAAVIFDAMEAARARGIDVLIADTAGRLHTQSHLMDELTKIARVMKRLDPGAPHEVLLVLDATTGQNGLAQVKVFTETVGVTGIVLTKLDGTARGGIVMGVEEEIGVPVKFVGVGEEVDDLVPFQPQEFVDALLADI